MNEVPGREALPLHLGEREKAEIIGVSDEGDGGGIPECARLPAVNPGRVLFRAVPEPCKDGRSAVCVLVQQLEKAVEGPLIGAGGVGDQVAPTSGGFAATGAVGGPVVEILRNAVTGSDAMVRARDNVTVHEILLITHNFRVNKSGFQENWLCNVKPIC